MLSRRRFLGGAGGAWLIMGAASATAQEGVFLQPEEAPRQLFPGGGQVVERVVAVTPDLQRRVVALLGRLPTLWETAYRIFTVKRDSAVLGFVVLVEEIGKHRPITYAVGVRADAAIQDVTVLAYREPYGGEVLERRFLKQYAGKGLASPLRPYEDIRNISGATLSVEATGRAVKKAIAVLKALGDLA